LEDPEIGGILLKSPKKPGSLEALQNILPLDSGDSGMFAAALGRFGTSRRRGLTLVELVVVMAILIALAGIVIPLLPGIIGRAETSARATNSSEIYKWIQTYEATSSAYPYDFDALIDSSGTAITYVSGFTGATAPLAVTSVTGPQVNALMGGGIVRLQLMTSTAPTGSTNFSFTFNPYPTSDRSVDGLTLVKSTAQNLATLTAFGQAQLNLSDNTTTTTGVYVVFGLGKRCSLVGTGIADAPVNFFDNFKLDPNNPTATTGYGRYGVVFQVNGVGPLATPPITSATPTADFGRAKLVRVFRFGGSLTTGDDAINSFWSDVNGTSGS
jgi:type II secretory pathway pseudopilin PulG